MAPSKLKNLKCCIRNFHYLPAIAKTDIRTSDCMRQYKVRKKSCLSHLAPEKFILPPLFLCPVPGNACHIQKPPYHDNIAKTQKGRVSIRCPLQWVFLASFTHLICHILNLAKSISKPVHPGAQAFVIPPGFDKFFKLGCKCGKHGHVF